MNEKYVLVGLVYDDLCDWVEKSVWEFMERLMEHEQPCSVPSFMVKGQMIFFYYSEKYWMNMWWWYCR
jgi:hypothetical protein